MKQKLTKALLETLAVPEGGKEFVVFDTELTGYAVKVTKAGAKRFMLQYTRGTKPNVRTRRLTLGRYGDVSEAQARKLALAALAELAAGGDPVARREAEEAAREAAAAARKRVEEEDAFTVDKLVESWATIGLQAAGERHKAESPRAIRRLLAEHLAKPARGLTQAQAQRAVDEFFKRAPVGANRARNYARAAFGWAARRKLIPEDPFAEIRAPAKERSRERVLTDAELGEVWRAAGRLGRPWGPYVRVLILTLQRRGEVAAMEWKELSADFSAWSLPGAKTKNKRPHVVHLAAPAREILRAIPRSGRYVFTTRGRKTPINSFTRLRGWLDAKITEERTQAGGEMPPLDWSLHDFRRAGVTVLAGMGFAIHVADRLLNHVAGSIRGVAAVYQKNEFLPERERALEAWAAYVLRQAEGGKEGANTVGQSDGIPAEAEAQRAAEAKTHR